MKATSSNVEKYVRCIFTFVLGIRSKLLERSWSEIGRHVSSISSSEIDPKRGLKFAAGRVEQLFSILYYEPLAETLTLGDAMREKLFVEFFFESLIEAFRQSGQRTDIRCLIDTLETVYGTKFEQHVIENLNADAIAVKPRLFRDQVLRDTVMSALSSKHPDWTYASFRPCEQPFKVRKDHVKQRGPTLESTTVTTSTSRLAAKNSQDGMIDPSAVDSMGKLLQKAGPLEESTAAHAKTAAKQATDSKPKDRDRKKTSHDLSRSVKTTKSRSETSYKAKRSGKPACNDPIVGQSSFNKSDQSVTATTKACPKTNDICKQVIEKTQPHRVVIGNAEKGLQQFMKNNVTTAGSSSGSSKHTRTAPVGGQNTLAQQKQRINNQRNSDKQCNRGEPVSKNETITYQSMPEIVRAEMHRTNSPPAKARKKTHDVNASCGDILETVTEQNLILDNLTLKPPGVSISMKNLCIEIPPDPVVPHTTCEQILALKESKNSPRRSLDLSEESSDPEVKETNTENLSMGNKLHDVALAIKAGSLLDLEMVIPKVTAVMQEAFKSGQQTSTKHKIHVLPATHQFNSAGFPMLISKLKRVLSSIDGLHTKCSTLQTGFTKVIDEVIEPENSEELIWVMINKLIKDTRTTDTLLGSLTSYLLWLSDGYHCLKDFDDSVSIREPRSRTVDISEILSAYDGFLKSVKRICILIDSVIEANVFDTETFDQLGCDLGVIFEK